MSHAATNWAILQRGLRPATKLVLWYLADRHNPDMGCFPTQARLAADAEMSVSSLNDHLAILEEKGLIRRERRANEATGQQESTRYILRFEDETPQEPPPNFGDGPSPNLAESRLRNSETNPVREEPVKKKKMRASACAISQAGWDRLLRIAGHDPAVFVPSWWKGASALAHVQGWMETYGFDEETILAIAEAEREGRTTPLEGPKGLDAAMRRYAKAAEAGEPIAPKAKPIPISDADRDQFWADWINSERPIFGGGPSAHLVRGLIQKGLVTEARAKERRLI